LGYQQAKTKGKLTMRKRKKGGKGKKEKGEECQGIKKLWQGWWGRGT
jgi:hypothetical protein